MKRLTSLCRGWVLLPLALHAPSALAHLGYPDTTSVSIRRGHPEDMFVGATFGAVVSRDSGKSWNWVCPEAMGYGGWRPETFLWQPDGTLLAATGADLIRSRNGGCTWESHPFFKPKGLWPMSLASPASNPSRLWVSTGRAASPNGLYRSDDSGETFIPTTLQSNTPDKNDNAVFTSVKVAPSDTRRLYVSGSTPEGLRLYRSADEGVTWEELPQPFPEYSSPSRAYDFFVLRVADNDPDHLWARVSWQGWTYVLESRDGGHTFRSILHPKNQEHDGIDEYLMGIEVSADAKTLWAATPTRLFRLREGDTVATLLSLPDGNACVERQGDVLFVCGATRVHDWALATTRDEGNTYTTLLNLPDLKPPSCPAGTPAHDICMPRWPQFASQPDIGADPSIPGTDGGTPPDAGSPDSGTPDAGPSEPPPVTPTDPPKKPGCSSTGGLLPAAAFFVLTTLRRSRRHNPEN
ncbi:exo-alpha-sialidase [Archangium violaceum]|uniref:WD40/YVTN/BNR-like repeat-containing protein n=1 Tax=Archangium violaceum TaxID=83451 RepID=UPI002B2DF112|nr:exo-alpha-sialidase [Archangium violaceum]